MILETAVGREKDVHDIDVHGEYEKLVVTLLVMRGFSDFPGASRACAYFRDPTAVSRFKLTLVFDNSRDAYRKFRHRHLLRRAAWARYARVSFRLNRPFARHRVLTTSAQLRARMNLASSRFDDADTQLPVS